MVKKQKTISNNLVFGILCLAVIGFGVVGLVMAYGESVVNNFYDNSYANQAPSEPMLGATVSFSDGDVTNLTDLDIEDDLRVLGDFELAGDFNLSDNGVNSRTFYEVIDFTDATVTPVAWEPDTAGYDDFYIRDVWLEVTGKATTSVRICVTTSTATFIATDAGQAGYLTEDAGTCTLMRTLGNIFGADGSTVLSDTATGTNHFMLRYPGTNTYVASQKIPVWIASTTNILVFATSSGDRNLGITATGNTFDGRLHIVGQTIE